MGLKNKRSGLYSSLIFLLMACVLSFPSYAKKLYKFQDEKGGWHYTDKDPTLNKSTQINVVVKQLKVKAKQRVWLKDKGDKQSPEFVIRNDYFAPIEVEIILTEGINMQVKPRLPKRFVVAHGESSRLIKLSAVNPYKAWQYSLNYRYILGTPLAKYHSQAVYYPPFVSYASFPITQAFNGEFSHTDVQNKYAVDFSMPEGSEVHAARAGIVMSVDNDFFKSGVDKQAYKARANSIRILHNDGSMAVYAHLQLERAQVDEGMQVQAGQLIAYSGNTGFSSGPHLHFAVQINQGMRLVSVPFDFTDALGASYIPKIGMRVKGILVRR